MRTVNVSAKATAGLISTALSEFSPGTVFAVNIADPEGRRDIHGLDVIWIEGPKREKVEEMLDRYQGVSWDPRTGNLDARSHLQVGDDGQLEEVFYDIDYIFCDGPTTVLYR
jgi:hypothetical protein